MSLGTRVPRYLGYWFAASFSTFILMVLALGLQIHVVDATSIIKSPYESGYDDGCNDSRISIKFMVRKQ